MSERDKAMHLLNILPELRTTEAVRKAGCEIAFYIGTIESENAILKSRLEEAERERNACRRTKEYWDSLYGQGLEIANWHENEVLEAFDSFWESAEEEYNGAWVCGGGE